MGILTQVGGVSVPDHDSGNSRAAVARDTANEAPLAEALCLLINDKSCLGGVRVIGIDERISRHTRKG